MASMPYIIDGHNLIPKIPGLSLKALDDETELIQMLQDFCRLQRKQAEVYFDQAPPGQPAMRKFGAVTAHFVRQGSTADQAIRNRLSSLGRTAANWTVVTSDLAVQGYARNVRAQVMSSEEFAHLLLSTLKRGGQGGGKRPDRELSPGELDEWLRLFGAGEDDQDEE